MKLRMTSVVILLVLAATVLVTLVALTLAERDMKAVIGDQQFALLSSTAAFIDDRLETRRQYMAGVAAAMPAAVRADPGRLQAYLESQPGIGQQFTNVVGFNRGGALVANLHHVRAPDAFNVADKRYFKAILASRQGQITPPFRSRLSGAPVVLVAIPVLDEQGEVALVLSASIDLQQSNFLPQAGALKPGKTGFIFIMTGDGILVEHPDKARLLEHINARPGTNAATEKALAGFEGWTEASNKDGVPGIYSYKHLRSTDWIVAARFPTDEAFAPMIAMRRHAVVGAAGFAAVAGLLAWLAIYRLLAPLEALRRHIAEIRAGRAGIHALRLGERDEIGELGAAFHELMAERETAQARTDDSERLIRNILDRAPDAFVSCDGAGRITEWNRRAEETFGWSRAEAVGANLSELIIPAHMQEAHLAGMAAFAVSGTGPVVNNRVRVLGRHRDGREIPVELSVGALQHGAAYFATAFLHDISDRIAYEDQIAASARRARIIADSMPALIAYVNHEQRYEFTNAHYLDMLGIEPGSMIGQTMRATLGEALYLDIEQNVLAALAGQRMHFELNSQVGGRSVYYMVDYLPDVAADGSVPGFYILVLDITASKEVEAKLVQLTRSDTLTGIANRRMFGDVLPLALERARRQQAVLALAYLDIDHFKKINDSHGHAVGDEVLVEFARRLVANVRSTDTVARLSGDEFVIILECIASEQEANTIADKVIEAMRAPFPTTRGDLTVTTSVGIALFEGEGQAQEALLANADSALYAAKRQGRNGYTIHGA
ncbi:MAG: diguanylate cyclase [Pseudomonadota bacterium]